MTLNLEPIPRFPNSLRSVLFFWPAIHPYHTPTLFRQAACLGNITDARDNTVFDRAITLANWLREEYPAIRIFREVDREKVAEFLSEKEETCTTGMVRMLIATLKKLQEGLYAMSWICEDIVPEEWRVSGCNPPRGPYEPEEAEAISTWVNPRSPEHGQALRYSNTSQTTALKTIAYYCRFFDTSITNLYYKCMAIA